MISDRFPLVSVIIVNTNELHHLTKCLPSVIKQQYPNYEVMVIDNASTDGSVAYIEQNFPTIRVVKNAGKLSYPGANNLGFRIAKGSYIAVLNPDTEVDDDWLCELVQALQTHPSAGLATSKILLMDEPSRINTCGNVISISGLTFCRGFGHAASEFTSMEEVTAVSGAAFLIRRELLETVGPFDEEFFAYLEDTDLSLRALLAGSSCLYVPTSKVYHKYIFRFSERKCFELEKNRLYMLAKIFRRRTLMLISPILFFTELLVWGSMFLKGKAYLRQKWLTYVWLWRNRERIRRNHYETQRIRCVSDRVLFQKFIPQFHFQQMVQNNVAKLLQFVTTPLLSILFKFSLRFVN